jgi:peptidyl-prolyl cis-trans isomerase D
MIRFLQTPGRTKKIVLGGLLLIICAAMVITLVPGGVGSSIGGPGQGVVATVGGEQVTTPDVMNEARRMLRRQFPKGGPQESMLLPYFNSQAAEGLIMRKAVLVEAERLGLRATNEDVLDELQHGRYAPTFFPGGKFVGEQQYQSILQANDLGVPQFEQNVKNEILVEKLQGLITGSVLVSDAEVHQEFEKRNTKVRFDYAVLRKDDLLKQIHPSEAELKAFYDRNKATYNNSIPEKRKIQYVLLDLEKIQAQTPVTHDDLQAYYNQHREEYRVPEQVNLRQIVIKTPLPGTDGKVDANGLDLARKKAEDVARQLNSGAGFEQLAKKYSDDPSGKTGGSIGWVQRGRLPAEVEKAAFSLPKGTHSAVINAGYAFVIVHVDDKQDAHVKSLDEVQAQIEPIIKQDKAGRAADSEASALLSQARNQSLDKAAAARGLQLVTTEFVSRNDSLPGMGNAPQFMDAVFNQSEKAPADEVQVPQGYAIFQVTAIKPPATPSFDEIRARVESEFKNEKVTALLSQRTQELADRAKAEHDLKKAAKELSATLKTSELVLPDGQVPDIGSMTGGAAVAFNMKPGEISGPINNGNTGIVLALLEKQAPPAEDFESKKDQIRDSLLQTKQGQMFELFVSNLRAEMEKSGKIRINQDEMRHLTRAQEEGG